jgi:hypothetical protein
MVAVMRSGPITRLSLAVLVVAAVIAATPADSGAATAATGAPATPATPVTRYPPGIPGIMHPVAPPTSSRAAASATPATPVAASPTKGARPTRPVPAATAVPTAGALAIRAGASLVHDWNGVSSLDSKVTNFGAEFEPPDQGLCVGNGFVIEAVNSAYRVERTDGTVLVGPLNVNDLFHVGGDEYTSDPRCYFDASTHTWFAVILFINKAGTEASTLIAVNASGDPTTPWTEYSLDATDAGANGTPNHRGCPCLGDQPLLGIDQANLYISTNEFSILGPEFNGAQIYAVTKADLIAARAAHFVQFPNLHIGGAQAGSVQPAVSPGTPAAEYFLNSLDPNGTSDNRIGVWAMTARDAVAAGQSPILSSTVIASEGYSIPPGAVQKGSTRLLDGGDDRMQQVEFIGGSLWGALGTAVDIPGDVATRGGVAWFRVQPSLNGVLVGTSVIGQQGYVVEPGSSLLYPALQADEAGRAAMVFTLSGPRNFPSSAYTFLNAGQGAFSAIRMTAHGTGPYLRGGRWGDYSFAALDASTGLFWLATEYVPSTRDQTPDGRRNWGTRVVAVSVR